MIGAIAEGNFVYLFLETLLKEEGFIGIRSCWGNYKKSVPLSWAKQSSQKIYRNGNSRGARTGEGRSGVE